jgi:cytochrome P450
VPHFAAYHSSDKFVEPDSFLPKRWLTEDTEGFDERFANDNKGALRPFTTGPRKNEVRPPRDILKVEW